MTSVAVMIGRSSIYQAMMRSSSYTDSNSGCRRSHSRERERDAKRSCFQTFDKLLPLSLSPQHASSSVSPSTQWASVVVCVPTCSVCMCVQFLAHPLLLPSSSPFLSLSSTCVRSCVGDIDARRPAAGQRPSVPQRADLREREAEAAINGG